MRVFILGMLLFFCSITAVARPKFQFGNIEIGGIRVAPRSWPSTAFIDFAWTPLWAAEDFGFHALFHITAPRNGNGNRFTITTYGGSAFLRVFSLINVEGSAGMQTWHDGAATTNPIFGVAILMRVAENLFDRIYMGYYWYQNPNNPAGEFRVGSSFNIF